MMISVVFCATVLATVLALSSLIRESLNGDSRSNGVYEVFHSQLDSRRAGALSASELRKLSSAATSVGEVAAYSPAPVIVNSGDPQHPTPAAFVTASYFRITKSRFLAGKDFGCSDSPAVRSCRGVVIGSHISKAVFSSDQAAVGHNILLNGEPFVVSGVVSDDEQGVAIASHPLLWISWLSEPELIGEDWMTGAPSAHWLFPVIRIPGGISPGVEADLISRALGESSRSVLLLTPGEVKLARTFRIRGFVVEGIRTYSRIAAWCLVSTFVLGFFLLARRILPALTLRGRLLAAGSLASGTVFFECLVHKAISSFVFGSRLKPEPVPIDWSGFAYVLLFGLACLYGFRTLTKTGYSLGKIETRNVRPQHLDSIPYFIDQHRYVLLCAVLLALFLSYSVNGLWVSDYWEHAAVIRELATHPTNPSHPIFFLKAPHAGFSPYALSLGLVSRWTGMSVIDTLTLAGTLNLLLLMSGLSLFIRFTFQAKHTDFYALLFILTLWGFSPFMTSGFLHLNVILQSSSYPATFATGVTFILWYFYSRFLRDRSYQLVLPVIACLMLVILDHPITAVSAITGLFALTISFRASWVNLARLAAILSAAILMAGFWPYYSPLTLFTADSGQFDAANSAMYPGYIPVGKFLGMTFLGLVGLPILWQRLQKSPRDLLAVLFVSLLVIYLLGAAAGKLTLGRVLSFMMVVLQISTADWIARRPLPFSGGSQTRENRYGTGIVFAAALLGLLMVTPGIVSVAPLFQNSYGEYAFLKSNVGQYDTVLADTYSGLKIPAFAGKVVAYPADHVQAFVSSLSREHDVETFLSATTDTHKRRVILSKYCARFILLNTNKVANWPGIVRSLRGIARTQYSDGEILLLRVTQLAL